MTRGYLRISLDFRAACVLLYTLLVGCSSAPRCDDVCLRARVDDVIPKLQQAVAKPDPWVDLRRASDRYAACVERKIRCHSDLCLSHFHCY